MTYKTVTLSYFSEVKKIYGLSNKYTYSYKFTVTLCY